MQCGEKCNSCGARCCFPYITEDNTTEEEWNSGYILLNNEVALCVPTTIYFVWSKHEDASVCMVHDGFCIYNRRQ